MAVEQIITYPHIQKVAGEPARLQRTPRMRVSTLVMDYLARGWSPDEMCRHYEDLLPVEAHAAMTYYYDHREEIEAEIRAEMGEVDAVHSAGHTSPFYVRMKAKGVL